MQDKQDNAEQPPPHHWYCALSTALSSSNEAMTDDIGKSPSKDSITLPSFISDTGGSTPEILHGEPLTDRKSTFQAHIATVHSVEEVKMSCGLLSICNDRLKKIPWLVFFTS